MTPRHLTDEQLSAHLDGALTGSAREQVERHLAECAPCRETLAALTAGDAQLQRALTHDPGEAYFESFTTRVEARIRAEGMGERARAAARVGDTRRPLWSSPRALAWAGGVAALAAGIGIAFMTSRETPITALKPDAAVERAERSARAPATDAVRPNAAPEEAVPVPSRMAKALDRREGGAPAGEPLARAPEQSQLDRVSGNEATGPAASAAPEGYADARRELASPTRAKKAGAPGAGAANAPSVAGAKLGAATPPGRAQLAIKDELQESRPYGPPGAPQPAFAPPPPAASAPVPSGPVTVRKTDRAVPMQTQERDAAAAKETESVRVDEEKHIAGPAPAAGMLTLGGKLQAGAARVCGAVLDRAGRPIAGAQVVIAAAGASVATDARGAFCLDAPAGDQAVDVLAIGFVPARVTATAAAAPVELHIVLDAVSVMGAQNPRFGFVGGATASGIPGLPDSLRAAALEARTLSAIAARSANPVAWDRAAESWSALAAALHRGDALGEARYQVALARWSAWRLDRTAARRAAAAAALDRYLAHAPAGPRRDQARAWRAELEQ